MGMAVYVIRCECEEGEEAGAVGTAKPERNTIRGANRQPEERTFLQVEGLRYQEGK